MRPSRSPCELARERLLAGPAAGSPPAELASHLATCRDCTAFAARLAGVRASLRAAHAEVVPGPDFAVRVVAALPSSTDLLGWAALRLLPAALALLLGLTLFGLVQTPPPTALLADPSSELLLAYTVLAPEGAAESPR